MAPSQDAAMTYILDSLGMPDASTQDKLLCVSRLRVVALALGAEKTRSELLPFLRKLCEPDPQNPDDVGDEVLTSIAEVLGGFDEFVGGEAHAHHLLEPLILLCSIDETTVRSQAVDAINTLGKKLSPEQIFNHLAPKVMELFGKLDWYTPRVSACGLVATAYTGCKGCKKDAQTTYTFSGDKERTWKADELAKELTEAYRQQFSDTEPMVRRTAAAKLAEAATSFGDETTKAELVDALPRLIDEAEQESIRVNALKSSPTIFRVASLKESDAGAKYLACAEDKSWRVRVAFAESLPAVANARKGAGSERELEECRLHFMKLLRDSEAEVRHATAAQSAAAASVLGPQFAIAELVPGVQALVADEGVANRVELAGVLLEMAGPIGMPLAENVYLSPQAASSSDGQAADLSLLQSLLADNNTNLRLAVIGKLPGLIDVLSIPKAAKALEIINDLIKDKNWRIRHAALTLLPSLSSQMPVEDFNKAFIQTEFMLRATDNCALIRHDWILCCKEIGDVHGPEWVKAHIMPTLESLTEQKNYQFKSVFLHAAAELGGLVGKETLADKFLPQAFSMVSDRVPNLRLMTAQTLGKVAVGATNGKAWLDASVVHDKIKPELAKLAEDSDVDVKEMASSSLEKLA